MIGKALYDNTGQGIMELTEYINRIHKMHIHAVSLEDIIRTCSLILKMFRFLTLIEFEFIFFQILNLHWLHYTWAPQEN